MNIIRTTYRTKTGTFTATNALFHPAVLNAQTGNKIDYASAGHKIVMPKVSVDAAGATVELDPTYNPDTIQVIGLFGNGANDEPIDHDTIVNQLIGEDGSGNAVINLPAEATGKPIQYLVKYEREVVEGAKITNDTKSLPQLNKLTLFCAMGDPCKDKLRPCYVVIPRFAPDPSMTLNLTADETTVDFSGNLNVD